MSESPGSAGYEVRVEGVLDEHWRTWFDGFDVHADGTDTVIRGSTDQAALHGVLAKIRDLGLCLVSVQRIEAGIPDSRLAREASPRGRLSG
jgi:hypothetical protein